MNCPVCGHRMVDMSHTENGKTRHWRTCVNILCSSKRRHA